MGSAPDTKPDTKKIAPLARYLARHPVTTSFAAAVLLAAVLTGSLWGADATAWGTGPIPVFGEGKWWTPLTALLVPDSPVDAVLSLALIGTVLAYAETLLGSRRTLAVGAVTALGGTFAAIGLHAGLWTVTALRPVEAAEVPVLDPAIVVFGTAMAASALASALWRRRLRVIGFAVLGMFALYAGDTDAWYRLAAALVGLAVGAWLARRHPRRVRHASSVRESRTLLAALVAVTGLGPLAALLAGGGRGPLSLVVSTFTQYDQNLVDQCTAVYVARLCDHQLMLVLTRGLGPAVLALVPLALLLVAAIGIRSGRRAGLFLAVATEAALAGLALFSLLSGRLSLVTWEDGTGLEYVLWTIASLAVPLAMAVVLIVSRHRFPVRATAAAARRLGAAIAGALVVSVAVFLLVEWPLRESFDTTPTAVQLIGEALGQLIPQAFLPRVGTHPYPRGGAGLLVYQWIGVAFWALVCAGVLWLYRRTAVRPDADGALYRDLLHRDSGTLGFLGTWAGNSYWYSDDRQSAIAYRLVGDVALALGDPLTTPEHRHRTVTGFIDFCVARDWTAVFYSVHDELLPVLEDIGWSYTSVGEETVMIPAEVTLSGKRWQKVRQPMTRAEREGMTDLWTRWDDLTAGQLEQVREIDEQWVADKALPEMGFTLGSLEELNDPDVALLLAVDAQGRIQVVTSWLPVWADGKLIGRTLDFMRRREDGPNGVMEYVLGRAALHAQEEGWTVLSLSGAPLATKPDVPERAPETVVEVFLQWLRGALEPAYGFASLFRFKKKFHPDYRTIYLAYGDPVALPRIGIAVGRAYLPNASLAEVRELARLSRSAP